MAEPAVAVGFARGIAFQIGKVPAQGIEMALNGAHIALETRIGQLLLQFGGRGFAVARNQAQKFDGKEDGVEGVGALRHDKDE